MAEKDLYSVLEVPRGADADAIKKAFRTAALKYHPDRNQGDKAKEAEVKFKEAKEAYEMLSDGQKRAAYDQYGHAGVDPASVMRAAAKAWQGRGMLRARTSLAAVAVAAALLTLSPTIGSAATKPRLQDVARATNGAEKLVPTMRSTSRACSAQISPERCDSGCPLG